MSHLKVNLSQILKDFMITLDGDDYASNASDAAIRNLALRGIREIGFDLGKKIKSLKLAIAANDTVTLPDDFVDLLKIGIVGTDGIIRVFGNNKNINYSKKYKDAVGDADISSADFQGGPLDIPANSVSDTIPAKTATSGDSSGSYVFQNYSFQGGQGGVYGAGGGHLSGEYRLNLDENRIEVSAHGGQSEIVLEYVADEARSYDPEVHVYAEEALRSYIYYRIVERKSNVPANEKARARAEYYNERRKANSRLSNFTKEEALKTIRKNFQQAPKY